MKPPPQGWAADTIDGAFLQTSGPGIRLRGIHPRFPVLWRTR